MNLTIKFCINSFIDAYNYLKYCRNNPKKLEVFKKVNRIKCKGLECQMNHNEKENIFNLVRETNKIPGDISEVGVYQGGSAKIICEAKDKKKLHLFDTFQLGLLDVSERDDEAIKNLVFKSTKEQVQTLLKEYENVFFYEGQFQETGHNLQKTRFSFVHLDVDTYKTMKYCLEFFYEKMNIGGVILSHDYGMLAGIQRAFDEFFEDKKEPILIMATTSQALIVKVIDRNKKNKLRRNI